MTALMFPVNAHPFLSCTGTGSDTCCELRTNTTQANITGSVLVPLISSQISFSDLSCWSLTSRALYAHQSKPDPGSNATEAGRASPLPSAPSPSPSKSQAAIAPVQPASTQPAQPGHSPISPPIPSASTTIQFAATPAVPRIQTVQPPLAVRTQMLEKLQEQADMSELSHIKASTEPAVRD